MLLIHVFLHHAETAWVWSRSPGLLPFKCFAKKENDLKIRESLAPRLHDHYKMGLSPQKYMGVSPQHQGANRGARPSVICSSSTQYWEVVLWTSKRKTVVVFPASVRSTDKLFTDFCSCFVLREFLLCDPAWPWTCDPPLLASVYWDHSTWLVFIIELLFTVGEGLTQQLTGRVQMHSRHDVSELLLDGEVSSLYLYVYVCKSS